MAIKTREELLNDLNAFIGDSEEDSAISLIEDFTDTLTDLENKNDNEEWKTKYEENDKAWRKKYRERFFSKEDKVIEIEDEDEDEDEDEPPKTFNDLFKTE